MFPFKVIGGFTVIERNASCTRIGNSNTVRSRAITDRKTELKSEAARVIENPGCCGFARDLIGQDSDY